MRERCPSFPAPPRTYEKSHSLFEQVFPYLFSLGHSASIEDEFHWLSSNSSYLSTDGDIQQPSVWCSSSQYAGYLPADVPVNND